jgi:hypothetical protein
MKGRRRESLFGYGNGTHAPGGMSNTDHGEHNELDGLSIDELEPRLTPDGWPGGGQSSPPTPPGGQVGWGC